MRLSKLYISIVCLLGIGFLYSLFLVNFDKMLQLHPLYGAIIIFFYNWFPGILALIFARYEKIKLPIFAKPSKKGILVLAIIPVIMAISFALSSLFWGSTSLNPLFQIGSLAMHIGLGIGIFIGAYCFTGLLGTLLYLGGELYWRGYLWDKLKKMGLVKSMAIITLLWCLWQMPVVLFSKAPGFSFSTIFLNLALVPVLFYFRIRGKSILAPAAFFGFFISGFSTLLIIFPVTDLRSVSIYSYSTIVPLLLCSVAFKLFSPATWKKII